MKEMSKQDSAPELPASYPPREQILLAQIAAIESEIVAARMNTIKANDKASVAFLQSIDCEKNLRKFIDSNLVPILRCKLNGEMIEANEAAAKLFGYPMEELNPGTLNAADFTPPDYVWLDDIAAEQLKTMGRALPWEKEVLRKDGTRASVFVAGLTVTPGPDPELFAFLIDTSRQKAIEADLKASETQFKMLAEAIPQLVWICDEVGRTTYVNKRFYDEIGLDPKDDDGYKWLKSIVPADRRKLMSKAMHAAKLDQPFETRVRYITKASGPRWHIVRALPMKDKNQRLQWFGTSTDIDHQVKLQERILKRETYFRTLANAIPQIVWTADGAGEIDFFNHRWFEYTGLTLAESQNDGWQFLIHPDDRKAYLQVWKNALATGDSYEIEFRLRRAHAAAQPAGEPYRWHLGRAVALRNKEGRILKWFATWTEIESQVRSEQ